MVETALERAEECAERYGAFLYVAREEARAAADEVDRRVASGAALLLAGVPLAVKDNVHVAGLPTTAGSRVLSGFVAPGDATCVARLKEAGCVVVGKTACDELGMGSSSETCAFGPVRNPWDPARVPGGSSGGSVASVAAGEAPLSIGTDTAGSIRQPAAYCGVVGMKPTYGRVSRYGLIAFASSLDCPGPIARNITDAALMLQVMAGPDPHDSTAANLPVPDYLAALDEGVQGLRIGLSPDYFRITSPNPQTGELETQPVPEELAASVRRAADLLRGMGAEIVEDVPMPNTRYGIPAYFVISRVEAASNLHRYDGAKYGYRAPEKTNDLRIMYRRSRARGFGPQPKLRILMGMYVSAAQYSAQYYNRALKVRTLIRRDFDEVFDPQGKYRLDALLTPTTPTTAFHMAAVYGNSVMMQYADQLTVPADHAGVPGISFPGGLAADGMPIGLQLLGPDFSEACLLCIARAYEVATESDAWRKVKPKVLR